MSEMYAGLDIGTSKVATIIATISPEGVVEVMGFGLAPSRGMKKGLVTDVNQLSEAITTSVREAEDSAECSVKKVFAGLSGDHIRSVASHGVSSSQGVEINEDTRLRAVESSKQFDFHGDYELLHAIPRHYTLDGVAGIQQPVGMSGTRLEADVLLIACAMNPLRNLRNCLTHCGIEAAQFILEHIASGEAILTEDEKELGVCLIDVGGGTTDIAVFHQGSLLCTEVLPIAGDHVTNDITQGLRIPTGAAEKIKISHGAINCDEEEAKELIEVSALGERQTRSISRGELSAVIRPRYEELFALAADKLKKHGLQSDKLVAGVVLTGGSCQIRGAADTAEKIFEMPARIGLPTDIRGHSDMIVKPNFSTTVGLLRYGYKHTLIKQLNDSPWWRRGLSYLGLRWEGI